MLTNVKSTLNSLMFSSHQAATNIPSSSRRESQFIYNYSDRHKTHIGKMLIRHIRKLQIECICQHFILPNWTVYPFTLPLSHSYLPLRFTLSFSATLPCVVWCKWVVLNVFLSLVSVNSMEREADNL